MQIKMPQAKLRGEFRLTTKRNGIIVDETDWMPNLITNVGLDNFGAWDESGVTADAWGEYCFVGSGTTQPSVTDTQLVGPNVVGRQGVGGGGILGENNGVAPYVWSAIREYTFPQGTFPTGRSLGEVGIGGTNQNSNLTTRALIQPPKIMNAIDQLTVTYRVSIQIPMDDVVVPIDVAGLGVENFTLRASSASSNSWNNAPSFHSGPRSTQSITAWTGDIGSITDTPTGSNSGNPFQPNPSPYVPGSHEIRQLYRLTIAQGNFLIRSVSIQNYMGRYQIRTGDAGIQKDNTQQFEIDVINSWARGI